MGGAGVAFKLLLRGDVERVFLNDYDKSIYAFWFSVINYPEELIELIEKTEISVEEWFIQKEVQKNKNNTDNLLELGFSTLFLNRTNRSGIINAGIIGGKNQDGKYKLDCRFNKVALANLIREISKYKNVIKLYNVDASIFIKLHISKIRNSFTFFDPPYYKKGPILYTNFYNHEDHERLSVIIKNHMKDKIWIMTYDKENEIYDLYSNYAYEVYYLRYSVSSPTKGMEYMFFSDLVDKGVVSNFLRIVEGTSK